jgi:hypothetical protein
MTDEGADGFVMRADRFKRLRERVGGGQIAVIDPALEFGERYHWHHTL